MISVACDVGGCDPDDWEWVHDVYTCSRCFYCVEPGIYVPYQCQSDQICYPDVGTPCLQATVHNIHACQYNPCLGYVHPGDTTVSHTLSVTPETSDANGNFQSNEFLLTLPIVLSGVHCYFIWC